MSSADNDPFDAASVVARIADGDRSAETELVQHFSQVLMMVLRQRTRDEQLAEDLHQDTLRIIIERLRSGRKLEQPHRLAGFVHKTAINVYIGYIRKEQRRATTPDPDLFDTLAADEPTALDELLAREGRAVVRDVIESMPVQRDRDILRGFYVQEIAKPALCEQLGVTSDNFDRVISRARSRFRDALQARGQLR